MTLEIHFTNGQTYERYMGDWSQRVGDQFLDWLAPERGLEWLDVGCGNGAFTAQIIDRCAPKRVEGIDPSAAQLAFARTRFSPKIAHFQEGDAVALPYSAHTFDLAVMPLVIFFLANPEIGVAEMRRVVRPGGLVTAYAWDMENGGFPYALLQDEMRAVGVAPPQTPHPEASRMDLLTGLWHGGGLERVAIRTIHVERTYTDFGDYWTTIEGGPSVVPVLAAMTTAQRNELQERLRMKLPTSKTGAITCKAWANAIQGRVPAVGVAR